VKNWGTSHIDRSQSVTKRVSWHGLHERQMRGQWRETGQCLWVIHCSSDHADSWVLTTSDRWSREQGCWHVLSQPDLLQRQEVVGLHQPVHAPLVHWQEDLPTATRLRLQFVSHHQLISPRSRHPRRQPLKHYTIVSSARIDNEYIMKLSNYMIRYSDTKHNVQRWLQLQILCADRPKYIHSNVKIKKWRLWIKSLLL